MLLQETSILTRLVEDLRTVALSESGTLPLHPEPTDLGMLVGETVVSFTAGAEAAPVRLGSHVEDSLPLLDIDPVRIHEVLTNLVENALRYTTAGWSVEVHATHDGAFVRLTVTDTGPGIDPALLPRVFERFAKGDDSRGFGLGLAIARHLVIAHGGTLDATSAPREGTTMTLRLPLDAPA